LSNYFFVLIGNHCRNGSILSGYSGSIISDILMFTVLEKCRKNYCQTANTYAKRMLILIVKENCIWHLNGYRNVLPMVLWKKKKSTKKNSY